MYNESLELTAPQHTAVNRIAYRSNAVVRSKKRHPIQLLPPDHYNFSSREHRYG
jgi:hypothetical protein